MATREGGFRARYRGTCGVCSLPIEPGSEITWSRRSGKPGVVHLACRAKAESPRPHAELEDSGFPLPALKSLKDLGREWTPPQGEGEDPGAPEGGQQPQPFKKSKPKPSEPPSEPKEGEPLPPGEYDVMPDGSVKRREQSTPTPPPNTPTPKPEGQGGHDGKDNTGVLGYVGAQVINVPLDKFVETVANPIGDLLAGRFAAAGEIPQGGLDAKAVQAIVDPLIQAAMAGQEGPPITITVKYGDNGTIKVEGAHKEFGKLLFLVGQGQHVYLYGPPGGGKSHAAKQTADTLKRPYGYISLNPQTPDSRLLGFQDASGNYRGTTFRRIYEGGGVFCIDELDNASPSLLTTLNGCLENGLAAFPDGIIERHPDFVVVATGNTSGKGANPAFPDRRPFDMAFAERFSYLEWGYDTKLEKRITKAINPNAMGWYEWVQGLRKWAAREMPRLIVSPRASFRLALYTRGKCPLSAMELINSVVFRGLDGESVQRALTACPLPAQEVPNA